MAKQSDTTPLTAQQEKFCQKVVELGNQSEAYRQAYPRSKKWKAEGVNVAAFKLMALTKVSHRVEELRAELKERHKVTADKVIDEFRKMAFFDAGDFFDWGESGVKVKDKSELTADQRAVVQEVSHTVTQHGGTIKVKLVDKHKALEALARHLGLFTDKVDHTSSDGSMTPNVDFSKLSDSAMDELAAVIRASSAGNS